MFSDENTPTMGEVECDECGQILPPGTGAPEIAQHKHNFHPHGTNARYYRAYLQSFYNHILPTLFGFLQEKVVLHGR